MGDKKGASQMFWIIISLAIALFVVVFVVATFFPHFFTFGDELNEGLGDIEGDFDADGLPDFLDVCPCTLGDTANEGCPQAFDDEDVEKDQEQYNINGCKGINDEQ